jgi:hypothetical protein
MIICPDANIVIYLVEQNPLWEPKVSARVAAFRAAGDEIAVCDAARLESLVGPFQTGNAADLASYSAFFTSRLAANISLAIGIIASAQTSSPAEGEREVNVMNTTAVVLEGRVQPDGTLEVTQKVNLPAGPVQVTVQPLAEPVQPDRFWKMMESIWSDLRAGGRTPRTQEEIDAEIDALRNEAEEEMQAVERLQEECRRAREQAQGAEEQPH